MTSWDDDIDHAICRSGAQQIAAAPPNGANKRPSTEIRVIEVSRICLRDAQRCPSRSDPLRAEPVPKKLFKQSSTSAVVQTPPRSLTALKDSCISDAYHKPQSTPLILPNKQDCLTQRIRCSTRAGGPYSIEWTEADTEDSMKIAISWLAD